MRWEVTVIITKSEMLSYRLTNIMTKKLSLRQTHRQILLYYTIEQN